MSTRRGMTTSRSNAAAIGADTAPSAARPTSDFQAADYIRRAGPALPAHPAGTRVPALDRMDGSLDFRDFLRAMVRSRVLIVVITALGLGLSSLYTLAQAPVYQSQTEAYVATASGSTASDLTQSNQFAQQAVKSYINVATSSYVLLRVIDDLQLNETVGQLQQQVQASAPVDTVLLQISVTDGNPRKAARIANSVIENLSAAAQQLTFSASGATAGVQVTQIEPASVSTRPESPDVPLNLGLGILLGLVIGVGLALLRRQFDTRIREDADVTASAGVPVLGEIPFDQEAQRRPLIASGGDDSLRAESFRTLRTNLQFLDYAARTRSITITSSISAEGKSTLR